MPDAIRVPAYQIFYFGTQFVCSLPVKPVSPEHFSMVSKHARRPQKQHVLNEQLASMIACLPSQPRPPALLLFIISFWMPNPVRMRSYVCVILLFIHGKTRPIAMAHAKRRCLCTYRDGKPRNVGNALCCVALASPVRWFKRCDQKCNFSGRIREKKLGENRIPVHAKALRNV
jgi:hypothetical protein